jgi:cardiolipin synthase
MNYKKIFENIWTIPNIMSLLRLALAPVIGHFIYHGNLGIAIVIAVFAGLLDIFDGIIARKYNLTSEFGKLIDPLADKVTYAFVLIAMILTEMVPIWYGILFISRDLLILNGSLFFSNKVKELPQADKFGKLSIFVNGMSLLLILCGVKFLNGPIMIVPLLLLYGSTINYFLNGLKKIK